MQRAPSQDNLSSDSDNHQNQDITAEEYSQYGVSATSSTARSFKGRSSFLQNASGGPASGKGKRRASGNVESSSGSWGGRNGTGRRAAVLGGSLSTPGSTSPIANLPVEGLAHIFARLPPSSLKACGLVCQRWHAVIRQDTTWRTAFLYHFNLGDNLEQIPGRRLAPESWRAEFIARHELAQRWSKSKTATITHDPRIGNISFIHAETALRRLGDSSAMSRKLANAYGSSPSMLSVSIPRGITSRSDPYNGKVAKGGFIEGAPAPAFLAGLGANLDTVTCAAISKEGSALVWGMANGSVHLSRTGVGGRTALGQGGQQRNAIPVQLGTPFHNHFGVITAIQFFGSTEIFATASTDGVVKIWDCAGGGCMWQSSEVMLIEGRGTDEGVVLAFSTADARNMHTAYLAVGSRTGRVMTWKVDLRSYTTTSHKAFNYPSNRGNVTPVQSLSIDSISGSLMVVYEDEDCFYRYDLLNRLYSEVITFGHEDGFMGRIAAVHTGFTGISEPPAAVSAVVSINGSHTPEDSTSNTTEDKTSRQRTFSKLAYVIAGDDQGRTFLWNWNSKGDSGGSIIKPIRQLQGFETKVTAIEVTDLLIFVGTGDGTIRAYDLLSGVLVRVFNERSAPRHTLRQLAAGQATEEDEARFAVGQITANKHGFVASIGARVLAWRVADEGKMRPKSSRTGGRLSSRAERYRADLEMKQEIRESSAAMDYESAERIERAQLSKSAQALAGVPRSLGDMTEEEATSLALMLSQEEEEERQINMSFENSLMAGEEGDELDLDGLRLDEEEFEGSPSGSSNAEGSHNLSGGSRSHQFSPRTSQSQSRSSYSYASSPQHNESLSPPPFSPSFRPQNGSNSKLQLSPRLAPQHYTPRSPQLQTTAPDMDEPLDWPLPSPISIASSPARGGASSPIVSPSATREVEDRSPPTRKKWSEIAGHQATPPKDRAYSSNRPPTQSLLSSQLQAHQQGQSAWPSLGGTPSVARELAASRRDEDMDEELRFVLELSRAEEESRQAAASSGK